MSPTSIHLSLVDRIALSTATAVSIVIVCVFAYAAEPAGRLSLAAGNVSLSSAVAAHVSESDACSFAVQADTAHGGPAAPTGTI